MFWVKKLVAAGMVLAAVAGAGVAVRGTADDPAPAELEQRLNHLHDLQRKLDVHRAELDAAVRQAKADLQRATARAEPRLVVRVGGRSPQSLPPVTVTEYRGDQPSWTAEFPRTGWTDPDWTPVREYLRRARQAAGGPQAVTVEMPTHGPTPHLRGVLAACRDAGFEAGRITAPPLPAPVAVVEAEGGGVAGDRLTLRVGGTARVAIREGELITHYIEEVHASRPEVARVTILRDVNAADIRGLAPGTTDVTMTDRTGLSHHLRVTVTAK